MSPELGRHNNGPLKHLVGLSGADEGPSPSLSPPLASAAVLVPFRALDSHWRVPLAFFPIALVRLSALSCTASPSESLSESSLRGPGGRGMCL